MSRHDRKSTLALKHSISSTQPRPKRTLTEVMKVRQKHRVAGPTTGCLAKQDTCFELQQRVRQPDVRYTQKEKKEQIYTYTHTS